MAGYKYRGELRGQIDSWTPPELTSKPDPKPRPVKREPHKPRTPRKDAAPCGTTSAYKRHQRRGEDPCEPCKAAKREYDKQWWERQREDEAA
jgi:hypothetical protein